MRKYVLVGAMISVAHAAIAEAPNLQTAAPVIFLADNLDEADGLGWCIDTLGRGFADKLQAHTCKPQGGDVQFTFAPDTGLIRSFAFADYCMEYAASEDPVFELNTCDPTRPNQQFAYDANGKTISPANDAALCVVVGAESRQAGPFMSRPLLMAPCAETDIALREWVVLDG